MYLQRSRGEALFGVFNIIFLIDRIGMTNTFWAMVIPFLVSPWNMLIMRNFFMALPESLEEAAIIDGATPLQTLSGSYCRCPPRRSPPSACSTPCGTGMTGVEPIMVESDRPTGPRLVTTP